MIPDATIREIKRAVSLEDLIAQDVHLRRNGKGQVGLCPFHAEDTASFHVYTHDPADQHYHCFGCGAHGDAFEYILKRRGGTFADVARELARQAGIAVPEDPPGATLRKVARKIFHEYRDADGMLIAVHERAVDEHGKKIGDMPWYTAEGFPRRVKGLNGMPTETLPLYRLADVMQADPAEPVILTEGEMPTDALRDRGFLSASLAVGSNTNADVRPALEPLRRHTVYLWPDNDDDGKGRKFMHHVARALEGIAADVRWLDVVTPSLQPKDDAFDYFARGGSVELLKITMKHAPPPPEPASADEAPSETVRTTWRAVPISELQEEDSAAAVWDGFLYGGSMTSLTALWKSGKTTLVAGLLQAMCTGRDFAGLPVKQGAKVLVVTEEHASKWIERRDELSLQDNIHVYSRPFLGKPTLAQWSEYMLEVADHCAAEADAYDLVIIDTVMNLWHVVNENDNAEVIGALQCIRPIAEAGAAVLLVVHPTKNEQGQGKATRGAGAWGGFVDVIIEMSRFDPGDTLDTRRVLRSLSRYKETPAELVLNYDLDTGEYSVIGTRASVRQDERRRILLDYLPTDPPGKTSKELLADYPSGHVRGTSRRTVEADLNHFINTGEVCVTGGGAPSDPRRYYRARPIGRGGLHAVR